MSDQTTIFNQNQNTQTPANNQVDPSNVNNAPNNPSLADLLGSIKNERGEPKYKSVEEALKALQHSQDYIPTLKTTLEQKERELEDARKAAAKADELERTIQELTQNKSPANQPSQTQGRTEEQLADLIDRTLTKKQQESIRQENTKKVVSELQKTFGEQAEEKFYARASELGMTKQEFNEFAARTPNAVLELMGIKPGGKPTVNTGAPPNSSINTQGFQPNQETFIRSNDKPAVVGATTQDLQSESRNAKQMVEELHSQGKSVYDLTDPKVYFKLFGK